MKLRLLLLLFCCSILSTTFAQVGIGNATPEAMLDITSSDAGVLLPRVNLTSETDKTTVTNPNTGGDPVNGTLVWNTGIDPGTGVFLAPAGFYYWQNTRWIELTGNNEQQVYIGRVVIEAADFAAPMKRKIIDGILFQPRSIEFTAISNTETENGKYIQSTAANDKNNSVGYTFGYAKAIATDPFIEQIAISGAGSGRSINRVGNYSSTNHCFAAQFVNQEAVNLGRTSGSLLSFNSDGFTLTIEEFTDPIVLLYKAYKY
ncbi:hypothetical protein [Nonlabens antarcticus]|uniref:hypothetical protein n=1 Tax=Nonlabens antarcticus TaxID=392714 RepID=UPI0018918C84|nr:hypothetical protein [Nonlabens antarcticus]